MITLSITKIEKSTTNVNGHVQHIVEVTANYSHGQKFFTFQSADENFDYFQSIRNAGYHIKENESV